MKILFQMVMEFIAGIREEKARLTAIKKKKKFWFKKKTVLAKS